MSTVSIEPNDQYGSAKIEAAVPPPPMNGQYNDESDFFPPKPVPYPICLRGVEFHFTLEAGQTYAAIAQLKGGFQNPPYRLIIFQGAPPAGQGRLFKEVVAGWPASKYKSHAIVSAAAFPPGQQVAITVTVDAAGENATITV
jgi:hypothetical protein